MSSGGKLLLTNSSLSSLPMYVMAMGMYSLKEGLHQQLDSIRSRFFWQGASDKFKYHRPGGRISAFQKIMGD